MYQVQKKRKRVWWFLSLFLFAFIVGVGIGLVGVGLRRQNDEPKTTSDLSERLVLPKESGTDIPDQAASVILEAEKELEPPEETYFVTAQGNKVSVFTIDSEGHRQFSHNLAIELDALREEDKQLFYEGITVYSKQELSSLMEDFSS